MNERENLKGHFLVEFHDPDGNLIATREIRNLVTTQGKNAMLDTFLGRAAAYAAIMFGLITGSTAPVAGDTYAAHGFSEAGTDTVAARLAPTYGVASAGAKATSSGTQFTITKAGGATITGLSQSMGPSGISAAGDTSVAGAILFSAGMFSSSVTVPQNSTVTVSYSLSF